MGQKRIGVAVSGHDSAAVLSEIKKLEEMGIQAAWLTTAGASDLETMTLFAAAALCTQSIMLGTSITLTFPTHPVIVAKQARVIGQLAPGRFRLGVGPGSPVPMVKTYGVNYRAPIGHLREYIRITRALLHEGSVDFEGRYYRACDEVPSRMDIPVMASAVGLKAFELCGEEADGAISWLCPRHYLREQALPAMKAAAERSGRTMPTLVAHAPVCLHDNMKEVRESFIRQFPYLMTSPFYPSVFTPAGFPELEKGECSEAMMDSVVLCGSESRGEEKLEELFSWGVTEIVVSPLFVGEEGGVHLDRIFRLLARVASRI